jgi:hypothetical protein
LVGPGDAKAWLVSLAGQKAKRRGCCARVAPLPSKLQSKNYNGALDVTAVSLGVDATVMAPATERAAAAKRPSW